MTRLIPFVLAVAMMVACGPSKIEVAEQKAIEQFSSLRNDPLTGLQAEKVVGEMENVLFGAKLTLSDIGTNEAELNRLVDAGWTRDAKATLIVLRDMKATPEQAKDVKLQFIEEQRRSQKVLSNFGTSEAELNRIVSRNALEFIQRNGGKPTPADYKAAGLPVPTITKTRTVIKRVPAKPTKVATRTPRKPALKPAVRTGG